MINSSGLVDDGLNDDCQSNGQTVWSYNQGLAIGGALELWRATGDPTLLSTARRLADAAIDGADHRRRTDRGLRHPRPDL